LVNCCLFQIFQCTVVKVTFFIQIIKDAKYHKKEKKGMFVLAREYAEYAKSEAP